MVPVPVVFKLETPEMIPATVKAFAELLVQV